jgi:hypothetical protein
MDRLRRVLAGGMLATMLGMVVGASGCRSTRDQVPPGPKYPTPGDSSAPLGFNNSPHPYNAMSSGYTNNTVQGQSGLPGSAGLGGSSTPTPDGMPLGAGPGGSQSSLGTPAPNSSNLGAPTSGLYGGPGTSGIGR